MDNKHTPGTLEQSPYKFGLLGFGFSDPKTSNALCQVFGSKEESEANAARIITTWNEYDQLKAENEKVKRLLHDLTPGGSEFYNDPEYCAKWIRENRTESHYNMGGIIKDLKAQLEAAKEREKVLREAAKGIIDNWEERMGGDTEVYKNPDNSISGEAYYSPSASMVSSSFIANLRKALEQTKH